MPTPTYTPLATVTLGSTASSVTFSSIPATYRDLILVATSTTAITSSGFCSVRFNADSGSNYSEVWMQSVGAPPAASSSSFSNGTELGFGGAFSQAIMQIMDYSATDKHKTTLNKWNTIAITTNDAVLQARAGRWANTAAITTVRLGASAGVLAIGTTFNLYGIAS
jgi:hypothetical protein